MKRTTNNLYFKLKIYPKIQNRTSSGKTVSISNNTASDAPGYNTRVASTDF